MMKKFLVFILAVMAVLTGCESMSNEYIKVEKTKVTVDSEPTELCLSVTALGEWSAVSNAEWCEAVVGEDVLMLKIAENRGEERSASVVVSCNNSMVKVTVVQRRPTDFVKVDKTNVLVGSEGLELTLNVTASGEWSASCDAEWCEAVVGEGVLTLKIAENQGELRVASVVLMCGNFTSEVTVKQRAKGIDDHIELAQTTVVAHSRPDTLQVAVDANKSWSVEPLEGVDWCSVEKTNEKTLTVMVARNNGQNREAIVVLTCGEVRAELRVEQEVCENVLVAYFMGSNNLSQALQNNMTQMEMAVADGALGDGRILVFFDQYIGSSIYELVDKGGGMCSRTMIKNYNNIDCTVPEVMRNVLNDIKALAPAKHYGFVFGGHANGWVADSLDLSNMNDYNLDWTKFGLREAGSAQQSLEHYGLWMKRHVEGDWKTRAVGYDGANGMDINELASALTVLNPDFVLFDACFMASVEALWEFRGVTKKAIASPIEIMSIGFPYTPIIKSLFGDWNNLAELCKIYIDTYKKSAIPNAAVALVDIEQLDNLAEAVGGVLTSARKVEKMWMSSVDSLQYYEGLVNHVFYDLGDCIERIATDSVALDRFQRAMEDAVLWTDHTARGYSDFCRGEFPLKRCSGLSVYIARERYPKYFQFYSRTGWAQRAGVITCNN